MTARETTELRYLEAFGECPCGRVAAGILRGSSNESYGPHCQRCADRRLKASAAERAKGGAA